MKDIYLECIETTKYYGEVCAADNISLEIGAEEFVTILGASGSGKTTLLMVIAGFTKPDKGRIVLNGRDITNEPPYKRNIGVVFQNYALFSNMTVFNNVAYPLRVRKVPRKEIKERVERSLDLVQLSEFGHRYPNQLSGGQQQRVALARASVFEPKLLLMDEPLGALDKNLREKMQLEIKHFQKELKITVLYVTHDQSEALSMSDRIAIVDHGRLEQIGTPRYIYQSPSNRFVADFIGEACFLKGMVKDPEKGDYSVAQIGGENVDILSNSYTNKGEEILLMIRPEAVLDLSEPNNKLLNDNSIKAKIEEVIYVGEYTIYVMRLSDGQRLNMKKNNYHRIHQYGVGDKMEVGWRTDDLYQI